MAENNESRFVKVIKSLVKELKWSLLPKAVTKKNGELLAVIYDGKGRQLGFKSSRTGIDIFGLFPKGNPNLWSGVQSMGSCFRYFGSPVKSTVASNKVNVDEVYVAVKKRLLPRYDEAFDFWLSEVAQVQKSVKRFGGEVINADPATGIVTMQVAGVKVFGDAMGTVTATTCLEGDAGLWVPSIEVNKITEITETDLLAMVTFSTGGSSMMAGREGVEPDKVIPAAEEDKAYKRSDSWPYVKAKQDLAKVAVAQADRINASPAEADEMIKEAMDEVPDNGVTIEAVSDQVVEVRKVRPKFNRRQSEDLRITTIKGANSIPVATKPTEVGLNMGLLDPSGTEQSSKPNESNPPKPRTRPVFKR